MRDEVSEPSGQGLRVAGLLLAAGAGTRMGLPKGLIVGEDGVSWVLQSSRRLAEAGCEPVHVTAGAAHDQVSAALKDEPVEVVLVRDWSKGMGVSLVEGLRSMPEHVDAALVHLVDLPGVTPGAMRRVIDAPGPHVLGRATYAGKPGHPVLLGRDHWGGIIAAASGDRGAGRYLAANPHTLVECADIADGDDIDTLQSLQTSGLGRLPHASRGDQP